MNKKIIAIGTLLIAKAALAASPNQPEASRREEIQIITIADGTRGEKRSVSASQSGPSLGDLFVFDQPLMDQYRRDIGTNSGYCVTTKIAVHSQCQWTLKLDNGNIVVAGQEAERGRSVLAVIGTTGKFSGFRGEMSSEPNGNGTFTQILTLFRP